MSARRIGCCWGAIASISTHLAKENVQFAELFQPGNSGANLNQNQIRWALDKEHGYTVHSFSKFYDEYRLPHSGVLWSWNKLVPRKVNILALRVLNARLPTLENLNKIGIEMSLNCNVCNNAPENEDHVLIHCTLAKLVWAEV